MIDGKSIRAIVKRFSSMEGVRGVIVCDQEGLPIQSDLDTETTEKTAAYITSLIGRARNICDALKEGELAFVRLETAKGEVMIANTEGLNLIVLK
ncbi:MAG: roadblock/LC7 domain-containing protein [Promethearchaeota archaeon]|jgi:predicted regulator of Ras-like GTPase activity (Roadblock/LC7/MglB family)